MAEIRIQEKKRPIWPWILLILIIIAAAILIYLYSTGEMNDRETEEVPADTTTQMEADTSTLGGNYMQAPGDNVDQFQAFTTEDTLGNFSKEFVVNGLNLLSGAVYDVVQREDAAGNQVDVKADSLISYTQNLGDTTSRNFSRSVNRSFNAVYEIINIVQKKNHPDLNREVNELRMSLRSFDEVKPVEAQERTVRDFFRMSGSILSTMKNTARAI
jgi:hypothetical protein